MSAIECVPVCKVVHTPIRRHPYFAARTKSGKHFMRRQKILRRYLRQGVRFYAELVIDSRKEIA